MALIFYSFHFLGEFACVLPDLLGGKGSRVGSTKGRKAIRGSHLLSFSSYLGFSVLGILNGNKAIGSLC
jgi:hypothetical protein